MKIIDLG